MFQLFSPPKLQSADLNSKAYILFKVIWGFLLIITIADSIALSRQPEYLPRFLVMTSLVWFVSLALLYSMQKGNIRTIAILYITFFLVMIFGFSWSGGGIKSHGMRLLPIVVLLSGLTVGRREVWLFGIISALCALALVVADHAHLLPVTEPLSKSPFMYWIYIICNIFFLCYIENLSVNRLSKALNASEQELALRKQSEEKYRLIFESFQDIYYQTDIKGKIILVSPSIQQRLGYEPSEVIGKNVHVFYLEPKKRRDFITQLKESGKVLNDEVSLLAKNGNVINAIISSHVLYENNCKPKAIEGTVHDITQRKRAEDLLKLQNEKLRDIAFLQSHIVRRPVSNVLGLINLINKDDPADPLNIELIPQLKIASNELDAVIREIVDKTNEIKPMVQSSLHKD
ncbi:PAS domain-containing protein [Solitalea koreensis]|uniref:histidine kinase n=1 Tax=Solitalea koreensis TaxID=543615 RepID=A0A521EK71_9SPHI|nr:PAS domain S-box protein [Solitalea koreensis]SMO83540.1 PAS domain S-box-containing protein [Solitalea koreensis]